MAGVLLTIGSGIGGLILVYLLVSHPDAVTSIGKTTGGFIIGESTVLQGR